MERLFWQLGRFMLGELIVAIQAFVVNLRRARADDPSVVDKVRELVARYEAHTEWPGATKADYVLREAKAYFAEIGRDIEDSLVNTLLELFHQENRGAS